MAKKPTAKKVKTFPTQDQVFQALFDRISEKGYGKARISDLADTFGVSVTEFYAVWPSVESILFRFLDQIDQRMIEEAAQDGSSKRDLYFDMLMSRFDTLQEYGPGVKTWLKEVVKQPLQLLILAARWEKTLSLMLDIAKDSPVFPVKKLGLGLVYISSVRAWLNDETEDMSKTMVAVDQVLEKAGNFSARFLTRKKA